MLSTDDCDDVDACLRRGVRGAIESDANWGRGDTAYVNERLMVSQLAVACGKCLLD